MTELPVHAQWMPGGKGNFPLRDTSNDVHHARNSGIAVYDEEHVIVSNRRRGINSLPAGAS